MSSKCCPLPAHQIVLVLTDKKSCQDQGKGGIIKKVKTIMLKESDQIVLQELGMKQVHQILRASVAL